MSLAPRTSTFRRASLIALPALLALTAWGASSARFVGQSQSHFADADDSTLTPQGGRLYRRQCAACHGGHLQGQPFWRLVDEDYGRRAPALDQTGPAWGRSDEDLFRVVKFGRYPETPEGAASAMPAYLEALSDEEIVATLAFVKSRWPIGLRALQATRNPGQRGMPAQALTTDWRLPANCFSHDAVAVAETR